MCSYNFLFLSDLEDKVFSQLKRRYTGSSDFDGEAQFDYEEEEEVWSFPLPELPSGQVLTLNLLTTWGDTHYIGLTGVEVYDSQGEHVAVKEVRYARKYYTWVLHSLTTKGSSGETAHTCSGRHSQYSCELLAWVPGVVLHG